MKWCSYHPSNVHSNMECHQQQSESVNINGKKTWCTYHESESHLDDECYHQRNSKRSCPAESRNTKNETFDANSNMIGCDKL